MSLLIHSSLVLLFTAAGLFAKPLPRVLILGDSIYTTPAALVAKELQGKVDIVCPTLKGTDVFNTTTALQNLEAMLGKEKWDLIHFNSGLGDLLYRAPNINSVRALPASAGGIRATSPDQYGKNLSEWVKRLKATGAKLVWASTTPINGSLNDIYEIGSEIEYNAIAARVMTQQGVPINNLHDYTPEEIYLKKKGGFDGNPYNVSKSSLHIPIVNTVCKQLGIPAPKIAPQN